MTAALDPENRINSEPSAASPLDVRGSSILVVDDNEQNVELICAYLEELGCEIRTASDGVAALARLLLHFDQSRHWRREEAD